ncbi:EI24 domain-containing protein [Magnetospirillum sp. 15-1]|uniref:EI24 domain-containing protein n=1 Tax=Magnetospirillum sp. 15-1 TaxID=1979370 RepID=UPI000BBC0FF5|nr:EI24 domain-containing protein [Magnetospirillum sp. 15-1]
MRDKPAAPRNLLAVVDRGFEQIILPESQHGFWPSIGTSAVIFVVTVMFGAIMANIVSKMFIEAAHNFLAAYASGVIDGSDFIAKFAKKMAQLAISNTSEYVKKMMVDVTISFSQASFPLIATAIFTGTFQNSLIGSIERRWYGKSGEQFVSNIRIPFSLLFAGLRYCIVVGIGFCVSLLPNPVGLIGVVIVALANIGFMSRCYFDTVALRRLPLSQVAEVRKANRWSLMLLGAIIYGLFALPAVNLLAAIIGTALMVHALWLFQPDSAVVPAAPPLPQPASAMGFRKVAVIAVIAVCLLGAGAWLSSQSTPNAKQRISNITDQPKTSIQPPAFPASEGKSALAEDSKGNMGLAACKKKVLQGASNPETVQFFEYEISIRSMTDKEKQKLYDVTHIGGISAATMLDMLGNGDEGWEKLMRFGKMTYDDSKDIIAKDLETAANMIAGDVTQRVKFDLDNGRRVTARYTCFFRHDGSAFINTIE